MNSYYEGTISSKSILEENKRKIIRLIVDQNKRTKDFTYSIHLAKKRNIPIEFKSREEMDQLSNSKTHGGMLLEAESLVHRSLNDSIDLKGFNVYVNGVEDPYNLGSICRTLYASGCKTLILPERDWSFAQSTILKASAGAYEKMDIYTIKEDKDLVAYLKKKGLPLISANRKNAIGLYSYTFPDDFVLALGGSYRGLSATIVEGTDQNIVIEYGQEFRNALDAPSAIAVFAFEILRQKKR
ncbi:MAG: RNA methyltransferase [Holdemanella sp.]|nr:RNA methyltransferase [Holdemanella sp.]